MTESTDLGAVPDYEAFADAREHARFTDWLRRRVDLDWTAATTHRFTRELASDDLEDRIFRRYLLQDYAFIETLVGTFGHAVGAAPSMAEKARLVEFLAVLTDDENDYFERSFEALCVPEDEYEAPELAPATRAFEDFLERVGRGGGYAETLAVLVPAEWIYLEWASTAADDPPSRFYLAEWIDLHANESFANFVEWLRAELDHVGAAASPRRRRKLERLFERTVALEVAFFDSTYDPDGTVPGGDPSW